MLRTIRAWLNWKVIFGGILFAVIVFATLIAILVSSRAKDITQVPATAMLSVIEAPTATSPAQVKTATPGSTPQSTQSGANSGGNFTIGNFVQVSGTGGNGLRLHESAGVSSPVKYIALEAEVFTVKDGPVEADGYSWWLLEDPYTENATGWGAANYLVLVKNP